MTDLTNNFSKRWKKLESPGPQVRGWGGEGCWQGPVSLCPQEARSDSNKQHLSFPYWLLAVYQLLPGVTLD